MVQKLCVKNAMIHKITHFKNDLKKFEERLPQWVKVQGLEEDFINVINEDYDFHIARKDG